jgi:hypothetical protein
MPIAPTMDSAKTRRMEHSHRSKILVSDSHRILVWEVSTIVIRGKKAA